VGQALARLATAIGEIGPRQVTLTSWSRPLEKPRKFRREKEGEAWRHGAAMEL
jgi:hypothetical protein